MLPFELQALGTKLTMLGVVYGGDAEAFVLLLPDAPTTGRVSVSAASREDWQAVLHRVDTMETEVLRKTPEGVGKALVRKTERQVSQVETWAVYRRDGFACRYCGSNNEPLTVDHLVLWEEGGPSVAANMVTACKRCNGTRGRTPYEAWLLSSYYMRVSRNLTPELRRANIELATTLAAIPRFGKARAR